ncbi:hypothetical protein, variant [Fonticula alba]|nr:hypothetical protein, variant [Fonticula alba]KCV70721.1 hypothetical protein, variant [Fonticula alba]|eukprot:XP_009495237.1 hypothetical protein, variant [Fonticula alba]
MPRFISTSMKGASVLADPRLNKGTAFSQQQRAEFSIEGLLPAAEESRELQLRRVHAQLASKGSDLERYEFLMNLASVDERLFYAVLTDDLEALLPVVYTPTVGSACMNWSSMFMRPQGLYLNVDQLDRIDAMVDNWPEDDVRAIVVTDGERILGLGDLGANGMGIPVGKSSLYSACAGIPPKFLLPVTLDAGTNNSRLLADPFYIGLKKHRVTGDAYEQLVDRFIQAARRRWGPRVLVQFEDFGNANAFRLLDKYQSQITCFNDDIQGTASIAVAGLLIASQMGAGAASASQFTGPRSLGEQTFLFVGAGTAATGIAELLVESMVHAGMTADDARRRIFLVDSSGLVSRSRLANETMAPNKAALAQDIPFMDNLQEIVDTIKPSVLIGVSGTGGVFTENIIRSVSAAHERPIIFSLSNPTANSECTASQAYAWSQNRAIFASGSPFLPVEVAPGDIRLPGQCNNSYIFPGVALGIITCEANHVPDSVFLLAAEVLADISVKDTARLERGSLFPPLRDIQNLSVRIAMAVVRHLVEGGHATNQKVIEACAAGEEELEAVIRSVMFNPLH